MRTRGLEFRVGLLIVAAAAILAAFVFVLGNFSFRSGFTIYVDYNFSGNVHPGAPVKVSGITVGKVESVNFLGGEIDEQTGQPVWVRVEVWIEDRAHNAVRQNSEFFINTAGVLGEQYLEVVPGSLDQPKLKPGAVARGTDPPRTDLIVSRLYDVLDSISQVLKERDLIQNLLRDSADTVSAVNTILSNNKEQLGNLIASTNDLASQASDVLRKVNDGVDPRTIRRTVKNADSLLISANSAVSTLTPKVSKLVDEGTRVTGILTQERFDRALSVADRAVGVVGQAGGLIDNVNGMVTDLRAGKGTAGALLVRDDIYADLREMIRDLRRNPWKLFWKE